MNRPSDGMTVDELRDEFDWISEFMSRMAYRIRRERDVHNLVEYVEKIEDENIRFRSCLVDADENAKSIMGENAKLRELVRHLMACERNRDCDTCPYREEPCDFVNDVRELGIEVDG